MKKILTVSLVAMMAVSAARADIASVEYVTKNYTTTTAMESAIATAKSEAISAAATDAAKYIDATELKDSQDAQDVVLKKYVDDAVDGLSGTGGAITALDARVGTAEGKITTLEGKMTTAEGKITTAEGEIDALQTSLAAGGATANAIAAAAKAGTDAASALEAYKTTVTNTLKEYSTTAQMNTAITDNAVNTVATGTGNGTIAVDGTDVAVKGLGTAAYTDATAYDAAGAAGTAETNAKSYTDTKIGDIGNYETVAAYAKAEADAVNADLGGLQATVGGHTSQIQAMDSKLSTVEATADAAVVANTAITAGTATKITYDAKGLVTKGEALTKDDIPTIDQAQVSGLTDALNNKQAKAAANPYQIVKEDGTWATLTYGLPDKCKGDGVVCSLISTNGTVGWEVVAK